jgi:hypothetical protein
MAALLPGYVAYLEYDLGPDEAWLAAVQTARDLHRELYGRSGGQPAPAVTDLLKTTDGLADKWRQQRKTLGQPVEAGRLEQLKEQTARGGPSVIGDINAVLAHPWLGSEQRKAMWKAGRGLAERLHQGTVSADQEEDRSGVLTAGPGTFNSERASKLERDKALRRARWSIALLQLEGAADVKGLEQALAAAVEARGEGPAWQALVRQLREAWAQRLAQGR